MKRTFTHPPIIPAGYDKRDYNQWQKYLQEQLEKINKPYRKLKTAEV